VEFDGNAVRAAEDVRTEIFWHGRVRLGFEGSQGRAGRQQSLDHSDTGISKARDSLKTFALNTELMSGSYTREVHECYRVRKAVTFQRPALSRLPEANTKRATPQWRC
jgi:hypothetical protein